MNGRKLNELTMTKFLFRKTTMAGGKDMSCDDPASQATLAGPKPLVDKC
jgi:hypothetical protein